MADPVKWGLPAVSRDELPLDCDEYSPNYEKVCHESGEDDNSHTRGESFADAT